MTPLEKEYLNVTASARSVEPNTTQTDKPNRTT